jgi:L-alanine-DL-glutamate epimerase-like enolase superfamily enzyme
VLIDRQLETRNGELVLPDGPGLGFDFDANALDRFAVDSWA